MSVVSVAVLKNVGVIRFKKTRKWKKCVCYCYF